MDRYNAAVEYHCTARRPYRSTSPRVPAHSLLTGESVRKGFPQRPNSLYWNRASEVHDANDSRPPLSVPMD